MLDYLKSRPGSVVLLLVVATLVYGLYNRSEEQPPEYTTEQISAIKTKFQSFPFPERLSNDREFSKLGFSFRLRGYGIGFDGSLHDQGGNRYQIAEIDVPNGSEEMVIVYRCGSRAEDPLEHFAHFIIEHREEDEYVRPRRTIELDGTSINFLSNGKIYKSHKMGANPMDPNGER